MPRAELSAIRKYYASTSTLAVDDVDFIVKAGEIHALVGENGAGKSTLARILCGFELPDAGTISIRGTARSFSSHRDAERAGIGFVPQYSMLAASLSAAENVALGHEPRRLGLFTDRRRVSYDFEMLAERFGFSVDADTPVSMLSLSERRQVEIMRALARGGDVLVLDEPTSILGDSETAALFALLHRLKDAGTGIVYISHRTREILDIADRVSVMRSGRLDTTTMASELDEERLAAMIVRSAPERQSKRMISEPGAVVFAMRGVNTTRRGIVALADINLEVRAGEVVVVVALGGNGLDSLEDAAAGLIHPEGGHIEVLGRDMRSINPRELRTRLVAYLPTDREGRGLCGRSSVAMNAIAKSLPRYGFAEYADGSKPHADAAAILESFMLTHWERRRVDTLSGGNRQRVVAGRELSGKPALVIAANPAQGLDSSARSMLFGRLRAMCDAGSAVLVLTSDPEDALDLADRTFSLYRGSLRLLDRLGADASSLAGAITGAMP